MIRFNDSAENEGSLSKLDRPLLNISKYLYLCADIDICRLVFDTSPKAKIQYYTVFYRSQLQYLPVSLLLYEYDTSCNENVAKIQKI